MVRLWSSVVVRQLPADWKGTAIYLSLVEVGKTCTATRRDKELADAKKRPYRGPQSRGSRTILEIRAISDDEWLAEAAEYDGIHRRKQKPNSEPARRERVSAANNSGLQDLGTPEATVSTPVNEVKEGKEVATRAEREAAHEKWKESITSRSRETSPDPYSYPVNKAKLNLAQGKEASDPDPPSEVATPVPTVKSMPQVEIYTKKTPHSQKALPTLPQHSGKTARMKPKSVSVKRPADDYPAILPSSKRGRTDTYSGESEDSDGDIEMGSAPPTSPPSSPSPESPPSDEDEGSPTSVNPIKPQSLNMTRGPGGSMRCLAPQCHFMEHEVESKEGQERVRGHFEEHQREDPVLRLAKMEGKLNGRSVGFLMEKLRVKEEEEARSKAGGGEVRVVDVDSRGVRAPLGVVRRGV